MYRKDAVKMYNDYKQFMDGMTLEEAQEHFKSFGLEIDPNFVSEKTKKSKPNAHRRFSRAEIHKRNLVQA